MNSLELAAELLSRFAGGQLPTRERSTEFVASCLVLLDLETIADESLRDKVRTYCADALIVALDSLRRSREAKFVN